MNYAQSIPRADLLVKKKELESIINDANKRLASIDDVLKMFPVEQNAPETFQVPFQQKSTNYEIIANILRENGSEMPLKKVFELYQERGGLSQRASFDVMIGKLLRDRTKKIIKVSKGFYKYQE